MIDYELLTDEFLGLVGWQQAPAGIGLFQLESDLTSSESGLQFNRHPYLTPELIEAVAPDYVERINNEAERATAYNNWLKTITKQGIRQALSNWWTKKVSNNTAKTLIAHREAFWYNGPVIYGTPTSGRRLGMYVKPYQGLTSMLHFKIEYIGIALSQPQDVTINFLMDGEVNPETREVSYTGNGEEQWIKIDQITIKSYGKKGFFVYYVSDNIVGNVITNRGSCNCRMSSKYIGIHGHNGPDSIPSTEFGMRPYVTRENYGLNIKLEGYCDYTSFVKSQKQALAPLISLQVADYMLRHMAANPHGRLNRHEGQADPDRILFQVDGDPQGRKTGVAVELEDAYEASSFSRAGIDKYCLPCNDQIVISRIPTG